MVVHQEPTQQRSAYRQILDVPGQLIIIIKPVEFLWKPLPYVNGKKNRVLGATPQGIITAVLYHHIPFCVDYECGMGVD